MYPATVIFLVLPFAWLPEPTAAASFGFVSSFVMAMGITKSGLHLLPLVLSVPFQSSAGLAQWSLLLTAALFYPVLGFLAVVKPQAGLPVLAAAREKKPAHFAARFPRRHGE
jgi:hypothetical protein